VVTGCLGSSPCGGDNFQPTPYDVTFEVCSGSSFTGADGGACEPTCDQACLVLEPATVTGTGRCAEPDAAALQPGATVTVHCTTVLMCMGRKLDGIAAPFVA